MTIELFCNMVWKDSYENIKKSILKEDYKSFDIPKKNSKRTINYLEKNSKLFSLQKQLNENYLSKFNLPVCVKGFQIGESYVSYLREHIGSRHFLRIDIAEFFPSITSEIIKQECSCFIKCKSKEDKEQILDLICDVTTLDDKLPQGASTSPMLSNIVMARIDQRILKYCQVFNIKYTRYADDMLFSSNSFNFEKKWFVKKIKYIVGTNGFKLNYSKLKMGNDELSLNGYVISEQGLRLSRNRLSDIRHILAFSKLNYGKAKDNEDTFINEINKIELKHRDLSIYPFKTIFQFTQYLCGYRAFLISFIDENDESIFQCNLKKLITKIEKNILLYD